MKSKHITLLTLFMSCFLVSAQIPGYLGKKFTAGYSFNSGPGWLFDLDSDTPLYLKKKHVFELEATVGRKMTMGLHYGVNTLSVWINNGSFYSKEYDASASIIRGNYKVRTTYFGATFKFFRKRTIAPIGYYFQLDMGTSFMKLVDPVIPGKVDTGSGHETVTTTDNDKYQSMRIGLGFGKRVIVAGPVYFDYALLFGLNVDMEARYDTDVSYTASFKFKDDNYYHVKVGLGYLF